MKKFAAGLIAVAMSVTMLAGCGVPANTVHSVDDLEGKTIGVQLGTTGDIMATEKLGDRVSQYEKYGDALAALLAGKVDCMVLDTGVADAFAKANNLDKSYDPYKAAYGSMPTHAASNQAIQQMYINGHFC